MKHKLIAEILQDLLPVLNNLQAKQLEQSLEFVLQKYDISIKENDSSIMDNEAIVSAFIAAKRIEGCSENTLKYPFWYLYVRVLARRCLV